MKILWSAQAEADLDAIHAFIARDSAHYADLQIKRILERVVYVASHPMNGMGITCTSILLQNCGRCIQDHTGSFITELTPSSSW